MHNEQYLVKNKLPDVTYVFTTNGVELAVLDVTHPLFVSGIDEVKLKKTIARVEKSADKTAEKFNNLPVFIKNFFSRRSFIMAELLQGTKNGAYLTGISTLLLKLGPGLIGRGRKRFFDRLSSKGIGGMVLRMRVRDMSKIQAEALIPLLTQAPQRNLCFFNIAGGAATDSINALFLIQQSHPLLLKNRKIEINVLDVDPNGPAFAGRCLTALAAPGNRFDGLDVTLHWVYYDWNTPQKLQELLLKRKGWLQVCASEGGLFEYGSDEVIVQNLDVIGRHAADDVIVAGSLLHAAERVDKGAVAALKITAGIKPRFLGLDGLIQVIKGNEWNPREVIEGNPRYLVFLLERGKTSIVPTYSCEVTGAILKDKKTAT